VKKNLTKKQKQLYQSDKFAFNPDLWQLIR